MPLSGNLVRYERYRKGPRTPRSAHARYYYTRSLVLETPVKRRQPAAATRTRRCQSAPKDMDSHSRSASPREPMRPQHRPPSPPSSPGAFDNRAYQHDDADPNHNDSFTSNGPQQNGHSKEPNGDTKLPEAVNLELINLTPKNGTKKKDVEVDMNASNPYDEYFVPVNEHRKFMRGEKLYVTADKRGEKGGCKRPLCWTLLVLVIAAVVAIIVLAATGVLFSGSPTTLEQYNTSISSARALNGLTGHVIHDHDHDHDHAHHDHSTEPIPTPHGPDTQNDQPMQAAGSDENDMSLYVPRTVEGELKIDNEEFIPELEDPESPEYREFVSNFADGLKRALFDRNTLENSDNDITVEVVQLRKGSVVVTYRIHWKPKMNAETTEDLLNATSLKTKLDDYLTNNNRMINVYHVSEEKTPTKHVLDICQIDNNHCEHGCEFDETTLEFTCTCPYGQLLDMTNPKKCMAILENAYPVEPNQNTDQKEVKSFEIDTNPRTTKPMPDEEKPNTESVHVSSNDNMFDWKETHHMIPETTTENEADLNLSHIFGHGNNEQTRPETSPEPTAEPKAEPEPTAEPEPPVEPKAEPEPMTTVEPKAVPEPVTTVEPKAEPEPAAEPNAKPEQAAEPKAEPEPTAEPKLEPTIDSQSDFKSPVMLDVTEIAPEPTVEPEPTSEPVEEPQSEAEAVAAHEPAAEPAAEPSSKHEPNPEPLPSSNIAGHEIVLTTTTKSVPLPKFGYQSEIEPSPEPQAEPEPTSESNQQSIETATNTQVSVQIHQIIDQNDHPTTSQHSLDVVSTNPELDMGSSSELEPMDHEAKHQPEATHNFDEKSTLTISQGSYDSKSEDNLEVTTTRISISEPNIINEPSYEPKPEIISILRDKNDVESGHKFTTEDNNDLTTEHNEWLQYNSDSNMKEPISEQSNINKDHNDSEQRTFKSIDIFAEDTTTARVEEKEIFTPSAPAEGKSSVSELNTTDNEETTTTSNEAGDSKDHTQRAIVNTDATFDVAKERKSDTSVKFNEEHAIVTGNHEGRSLESDENTATTAAPESGKEHSISAVNTNFDVEKKLIEALENRHETKTETNTETNAPDEGMDITFDTINMLYNRSSKSVENKNMSKPDTTPTTITETSTDMDWLSETVTELKYDEAMNKMENHETTQPSITKIDDIMNSGTTKDDFEPDYLNNMSSNNNKMTEQDEPLYGMAHDYDSEDSRVKRVNEENSDSSGAIKTEITSETTVRPIIAENNPASIETTTVIDYIYKSAEKAMNESDTHVTPSNVEVISLTTTSSTERSEPAPVWEDSEPEKDLTVKELEKPVTQEESTITRIIPINEIVLTTTTTAKTTTLSEVNPTTISPTYDPTSARTTTHNLQVINKSGSELESQTQVNNLNVTIYEISSHNGNNSFAVTNQHSSEFEDHETEMNPFLPEVENNKILVKKLQEGHDIEPTNFNETQNENAEEHFNNTAETTTRAISNNDFTEQAKVNDHNASTNATPASTEVYTTFNELMKSNSEETKVKGVEVVPIASETVSEEKDDKPEEKDLVPISTFFLDTDDLVNNKDHTTEHKTTITKNNLENEAITSRSQLDTDDESDYLRVVPIEEEKSEEKESLKKGYGSELNDISDSPKKSDRRTLDETKFDTVNDNEA